MTSVSPDGRRLIARRGPRGRRHLVIAEIPDDRRHRRRQRRVRRLLAADFPDEGTDLAEDGRFAPDGTAVYLRTVAGRERYRARLGAARRARHAGAAAAAGRTGPDADLESYAILAGGQSALLVWNVDGISTHRGA